MDKSKKPGSDKLLDQLNKINDTDSIVTENISAFNYTRSNLDAIKSMKPVQEVFVERDDPSVQCALERIARLQQIKRINNDKLDLELFGDKFNANKPIKLFDLAKVFQRKCNLTELQSIKFARYLIEEKTEEQEMEGSNQVTFDPHKTIDLQTVSVRLMTNSLYPVIFQDSHETQAKEKFTEHFKGNQYKFFKKAQSELGTALISYSQFKQYLMSQGVDNKKLAEQDIECAYIILCRKVNFNLIHILGNSEIERALIGFQASTISQIFTRFDDKEEFERTQIDLKKSSQDSEKIDSKREKTDDPVTPQLGVNWNPNFYNKDDSSRSK